MIRHIVLFHLRPDLALGDLEALISGLESLGDEIDVLSNVGVGHDISGRSEFGLALTCDLPSADALTSYLEHPAHQAVIESYIKPACVRWVVVDHEL